MQRLLMFLLTVLAGLAPAAANAWWQADWQYRKQITVDTTPQGARSARRPFAAAGAPAHRQLHFRRHQREGHIRFVAADDQTVLNHQPKPSIRCWASP